MYVMLYRMHSICSNPFRNYADNEVYHVVLQVKWGDVSKVNYQSAGEPTKKTKTGTHLKTLTPQIALQESSVRAGGTDSTMKLSHYETISSQDPT